MSAVEIHQIRKELALLIQERINPLQQKLEVLLRA